MLMMSKDYTEDSEYDRNMALEGLMNTFLGERLPRFKAAAVPHEDNASLS